ncbi:MAG: ABC transporter ATP-binding protein, partial [Bacteroidota bacterium]
ASVCLQEYRAETDPIEKEVLLTYIRMNLADYAWMVLLFAGLMGLFMFLMRKTIIVVSRLIEYDLRRKIFGHYEALDSSFYRKNPTGDLMSRITEDVSKVRMYLGPGLLYCINLVTLFCLAIYYMYTVNPKLTLCSLIPLPFLSLSIYYVSSLINKRSVIIQRQLAKLNTVAQEVYSGIRVIKSYAKEDQFRSFFAIETEEYKSNSMDLGRVNAFFQPLMILLVSLSILIVVVVGGQEVAKGNITHGNIAEFIIYVNMLTWPFTAVGWIVSIVQQAEASQGRILEYMRTESMIVSPTTEELHVNGHIEFRDVSFTYPEEGAKALKGVSFTVNKGENLGIIGRTASGKSTIASLLLRMMDVNQGQILIDGRDIRELNLDQLRAKVGYVPQDAFLFSDTVARNVSFGESELDMEQIEFITKKAAVYDDIVGLSDGFETLVGERGVTLSGGQKQRIALARALIKTPEIIILDDCLSAVDTTTEQ